MFFTWTIFPVFEANIHTRVSCASTCVACILIEHLSVLLDAQVHASNPDFWGLQELEIRKQSATETSRKYFFLTFLKNNLFLFQKSCIFFQNSVLLEYCQSTFRVIEPTTCRGEVGRLNHCATTASTLRSDEMHFYAERGWYLVYLSNAVLDKRDDWSPL